MDAGTRSSQSDRPVTPARRTAPQVSGWGVSLRIAMSQTSYCTPSIRAWHDHPWRLLFFRSPMNTPEPVFPSRSMMQLRDSSGAAPAEDIPCFAELSCHAVSLRSVEVRFDLEHRDGQVHPSTLWRKGALAGERRAAASSAASAPL